MKDEALKATSEPRRPRPRFSLLTLLLLTTIVALGVVVWKQNHTLIPMQQELRQLRGELGQLTIEDPTKAYAVAVQISEPDTWKWRIYLPPGGTYSFNCLEGTIPSQTEHRGKELIQEVKNSGSGSTSSGTGYEGEFTLSARLFKRGNKWFISYQSSHGKMNGSLTLLPSFDEWLSDPRSRTNVSNISYELQAFSPGEPMLLLHLARPKIIENADGGWSKKFSEGSHEGFVIWIE